MIARLRGLRCLLAASMLSAALPVGASAGEQPQLEPYQMVRSLQLLQDRIASGDHAALPMQRKLLEMIDRRFQSASPADFLERRNFLALLVYAMSGGNPRTVATLLKQLHLDEKDRHLGTGVLSYLEGKTTAARNALETVDPLGLPPELGAFFALVKGFIHATDDVAKALSLFDQARLLGPGTLVEEAALRRSLPLEARRRDGTRFLATSDRYVRHYLHSPYAGQFADEFVSGIIALHGKVDLAAMDEVVSLMDGERRRVIYLRLARRAAIEGLTDLIAHASGKVAAAEAGGQAGSDPRAALYSSLATLTSENVAEILPRLRSIDRSMLSESDRSLLEAAEAIAVEVTAAPAPAPEQETLPDESSADTIDAADPGVPDGLPEAEPIEAGTAAPAEGGLSPARPTSAGEDSDPFVVHARKTLDAIDTLLLEDASR